MKLIRDYPPETQWQTRNGQQTGRHVGTLKNGHEVFIMDAGNFDYAATRYPDGRTASEYAHDWDIIPAHVKREGWVNVYRSVTINDIATYKMGGTIYSSKAEAVAYGKGSVDSVPIEWTDGEGLP